MPSTKDLIFTLKNLIFAGGGLRGIAVLGALQAIRDETGADFGLRNPKLENICGVSIGCLYALCLCIGYSVSELTDLCFKLNQNDILEPDPLRIVSAELSVDSGQKLKKYIEYILQKKNFQPDLTFKQLYEKTSTSLHVVVTNLSLASVEHLTKESYPELSIVTAIMASMALPLVFPPIDSPNGHKWIDGGCYENYPIQKYNAYESLGIDFGWKLEKSNFDNLPRYLLRIIQVMQVPIEIASWSLLSLEHKKRTIKIMTGCSSALESALSAREISPETRLNLQRAGFSAAKNLLKNFFKSDTNIKISDKLSDPGDSLDEETKIVRTLPTYLYSCNFCFPPENAILGLPDETWKG